MDTSKEDASDEVPSNKLLQKENCGTECHASVSNQKRCDPSALPEIVSDEGHEKQTLDSGGHTSSSKQEGFVLLEAPEKSSEPREDSEDLQHRRSPENRTTASQSNQAESSPKIITDKGLDDQQRQDADGGVTASQYDQEKFILPVKPEKVLDKLQPRRNPDAVVRASQVDPGLTPRLADKASEDGYNWRKYGQKFVRGNEFVRSYYKCTYPSCPAKKQVERLHDGKLTDVNYLGRHEHPKLQPTQHSTQDPCLVLPIQTIRPLEHSSSTAEDEYSSAQGETSHHIEQPETLQLAYLPATENAGEGAAPESNKTDEIDSDNDQSLKKQKRDIPNVNEALINKLNGESRVVVQKSEVDVVNDGYRWRKYGQKLVKGNPNPRSYYRCSTSGCPVKKHVERASYDSKMVITTYEGEHDHDIPAARTVTPNTSGANSNTTALNGDSISKPEENEAAVNLDMVVHVSAN